MTRIIKRVPQRKNDFGGMLIDFTGQTITMEQLMGSRNLVCGSMIRILWAFAREHNLISKGRTST